MCGRAPEGHPPVRDITDTSVHELCQVLGTGVGKRLATKPPTQHYQFSTGFSLKQFKSTD